MSEEESVIDLPPRRELFAQEYIKDFNGAQSAIRAGYAQDSARQAASQLLTFTDVKLRIDELLRDRLAAQKVTHDRIIAETARIAFHDPRNFFHDDGRPKQINELDDDTASALAGMEITTEKTNGKKGEASYTKKYKLNDKTKALEMLAKWKGMLVDRTEISAVVEINDSRTLLEKAQLLAFALANAASIGHSAAKELEQDPVKGQIENGVGSNSEAVPCLHGKR